jgi:hypothetical protein
MATIVCVVGDKGGTGKSTWARGLADLYRHTQQPAALFDGDWLARSLFKCYRSSDEQGRSLALNRQDPRRGCLLYDARDRRFGRDLLLNSMAMPGIDVILHDLPAGFRTDIAGLMSVADPAEAVKEFVGSAAAMGHAVLLVNVMTPSPSDYHTAPWLAEAVGRYATVVAVRNGLFDASSFSAWQREAAKGFAAAGGIEIEMPRLDPEAAIFCDQKTLRFTSAIQESRVPLADRMRVLSWLRRFAESVSPIAEALRLPTDIAAHIAALRIEAPAAPPRNPPVAGGTEGEAETPADSAPLSPAAEQVMSDDFAVHQAEAPQRHPLSPAEEETFEDANTGDSDATSPRRRKAPVWHSLSGLLPNARRSNGKAANRTDDPERGFLLPAEPPIL